MPIDFENSFSGYTAPELPEYEELAVMDDWSYGRWEQEFQDSRLRLTAFLDAREPYLILARSVARHLGEPVEAKAKLHRPEQAEVCIRNRKAHALELRATPSANG